VYTRAPEADPVASQAAGYSLADVTAPRADRERIYTEWCSRLEVIKHELYRGFLNQTLWEE
jgi:hypothetical protein